MIQGHGDDLYSQKYVVKYNFSSNVDRHKDYSNLRLFLSEKMKCIHSYPEPEAESLRKCLAIKENIEEDNLLITNGATEAIYLIAQTYKGANTGILIPTFSEYEDACSINKHKLSFFLNLDNLPMDLDLIWICNPNNPTGRIINKESLIELITSRRKTLFIIDQSYEYFSKEKTLTSKALTTDNVILLHSMTKHFSIPGLRLGYITGCSKIIQKIRGFKMPWSVNQLAIEAGKYLINSKDTGDIDTILKETQRLKQELEHLNIVDIMPSDTHYLLCKLQKGNSKELKEYLLKQHAILIRDASNFRGLDKTYFRIASQSRVENNLLIKAIKLWANTK